MFTMDGVSAMSGLATALQGILTTDSFMANLTTLVPVIGGVLIFALPLAAPLIIFLTNL